MDLVIADVHECGKVLYEIRIGLVDEAKNELSSVVVAAGNDSAHAEETVDLSDIEVGLLSDHTEKTVFCALQVSTSIAIGDTDGVVG